MKNISIPSRPRQASIRIRPSYGATRLLKRGFSPVRAGGLCDRPSRGEGDAFRNAAGRGPGHDAVRRHRLLPKHSTYATSPDSRNHETPPPGTTPRDVRHPCGLCSWRGLFIERVSRDHRGWRRARWCDGRQWRRNRRFDWRRRQSRDGRPLQWRQPGRWRRGCNGRQRGTGVAPAAGPAPLPGGKGGSAAGGNGGAGTCPAPTATGETVMSLAGTWTFTPSGAAATTIMVPGGGWVAQGFRSVNQARYQRMATVPDLGRAQATYLEFGAINHEATLTVDSTMVGTQTTSFTPSVFDVTSAVKPGMSHSFIVDVKGRNALKGSSGKKLVPDAAGWSANVAQGIFRSAVLHVVPALHVFETLVRTDVAADQFSIDVWVKNDGAVDRHRHRRRRPVELDLRRHDLSVGPLEACLGRRGQDRQGDAGAGDLGAGRELVLVAERPLRAGYRAKLHVARVTVTPDAASGGAAAAHSIPVRFGFRQSRQVGAHYELNGVPIKFRGDNVQGADYDSIKNAGVKDSSDAYDLFPGFLPPSANNPGWPQAVDNWQRLNYNVARLHQEPVSPYMLDVMDEMGMMVIDESAIRGSNNDQDFKAGSANMIAHLNALVHRDRNHPCVIRWSQCNEPENDNTNSSAFQQQLYHDGDRRRRHPAGQRGRRAVGAEHPERLRRHRRQLHGVRTLPERVRHLHPRRGGQHHAPLRRRRVHLGGRQFGARPDVVRDVDGDPAPEGPVRHPPLHAALVMGQLRPRREGKHDDHRAERPAPVRRGQAARCPGRTRSSCACRRRSTRWPSSTLPTGKPTTRRTSPGRGPSPSRPSPKARRSAGS